MTNTDLKKLEKKLENKSRMTIVKLDLISKNNRKNGIWLYMPIVEKDGRYYRCESILSRDGTLKKDQVNPETVKVTSEIKPEYYAANGLPVK